MSGGTCYRSPQFHLRQVHVGHQMCGEAVRRGEGWGRCGFVLRRRVLYISRSSIGAPIGPTSRSLISSSSSVPSLSRGRDMKPSPIRLSRVTRRDALALSKLAFQSKAGGKRSCRAAAKAGHLSSICSGVRSPPQLNRPGGSPGQGSEGAVFVCSRNSALREAGLYARSSLGNAVVGFSGNSGSGGFLVTQSFNLY